MAISTFYIFVSVSIRERREKRRIKIRESRNRNGETTGFPFISPDLKGLMWQLLKVVQSSKVSEEPAPQVLWWKLKFRGQKTNKELHHLKILQVSANNHLPVLFLLPKMC